jgi:uncharacterized protein (TIGR02246 family)
VDAGGFQLQRGNQVIYEFGVLAITLAVALGAPGSFGKRNQDETEIRAVEQRMQDAWNQHNPRSFAKLFSEDGDHINLFGWWWKGRAAIETGLTNAHTFIFRESLLTHTDVNVRLLDSQTAVVHIAWTMAGQKSPDGSTAPLMAGLETQIVRKQHGKWLIAAFHNTKSVPETPFPQGPSPKK